MIPRRVPVMPLTTVRIDKTGPSDLPNWTVPGESTTSSTLSMKGGNSGHNGSDLDKGNILKPTFDTLMEEGRKAFDAYGANLEDTTPIVFTKPEVIPKVHPNPSPSLNDVQNMINSALERQEKSTNELLCRLIEEWDRKRLDGTSANPSSSTGAVSFTQTNPHISGPLVSGTSMPNPSA
jgi:hypothetical protein